MRIIIFLLISCFAYGQRASDFYQASAQQAGGGGGGGVPVVESFSEVCYEGTDVTSIVIPKPTGLQIGDCLVCWTASDVNDVSTPEYSASSDPPGWTFVQTAGTNVTDAHLATFWKIATATETAASNFTFTQVTAAEAWGACIRLSGVFSTAIGTVGTAITNNNASSHAVPGITTANANSLAMYGLVGDGTDTAPFTISGTGWSEGDEIDCGNVITGVSGVWGTKEMATAGATGDATVGMAVSDGAVAWIIEIRSE